MWEYLYFEINQVSSISTLELARTNATWLTLTENDFKCEETEKALLKRRDAKTAIEATRKIKGCGVISSKPKIEIDGIEYYSCLCHGNFKDESTHHSIFLYKQWKNGMLAYDGSLMDQPNKYIELMQLLDHLHIEYENKIAKEREKKNGK